MKKINYDARLKLTKKEIIRRWDIQADVNKQAYDNLKDKYDRENEEFIQVHNENKELRNKLEYSEKACNETIVDVSYLLGLLDQMRISNPLFNVHLKDNNGVSALNAFMGEHEQQIRWKIYRDSVDPWDVRRYR